MYVCGSQVLAELSKLIILNRISEDDPTYVTRFKTALRDDLKLRRLNVQNCMLVKVATALDPRTKSLECIPRSERAAVWTFINNLFLFEISQMPSCSDVGPTAKKFKFDHSDDDDDDCESEKEEENHENGELHNELRIYRTQPEQPDNCDPLHWWKTVKLHPALKVLSRKYLACPATSVPCERVFSSAGNIISKKRCSINKENANTLICLSSWL